MRFDWSGHVHPAHHGAKGPLGLHLHRPDEHHRIGRSHPGVVTGRSGAGVAHAGAVHRADRAGAVSVQTAQAAVASAQARQHPVQSQVLTATRNWRQQQAQVESVRAEATRTATDVLRCQQLFAQDEVSRQQLDNAIAASRVDVANLSTARHRADVARAQTADAAAATAAQNVAQSESRVTKAQTRIAQIQAGCGAVCSTLSDGDSLRITVTVGGGKAGSARTAASRGAWLWHGGPLQGNNAPAAR